MSMLLLLAVLPLLLLLLTLSLFSIAISSLRLVPVQPKTGLDVLIEVLLLVVPYCLLLL